ncbi:sodium-dependent bicarbonate transport family permease [bacterium]|nr:sodium-dependent bicarbonate transport family permease [bacterium]
MQDTLHLIRDNMVSPIVLAFVLGIVATLIKSDLKIPESIFTALSIYFLFGLGLQGGAQLVSLPFADLAVPIFVAVLVGAAIPVVCSMTLTKKGEYSATYAAAIAAHYGFVSTVTLYAAMSWLSTEQIPFEGYLPALAAAMELASLIAVVFTVRTRASMGQFWGQIARDILFGKTILLVVGGTIIGIWSGKDGYNMVAPCFLEPFQGIACLFMMELGIVAAKRLGDLRDFGVLRTIATGIFVPMACGVIGVILGDFANLSLGGRMALGVICASSSYLAAAIAVRVSMPKLNPDYYFTTALAVSLPFNLVAGFPIYLYLAQVI